MKHLNKINLLRIIILLTGCSIGYSEHPDENIINHNEESYSVNFEESVNQVIVSNYEELKQAVSMNYTDGDITILCEDGVYQWPDWAYFNIKGDNTTIRSLSGDRSTVVFKGQGMSGNGNSILHITADYVTIKDVTITDAKDHGIQIHGESSYNADYTCISNVIFKDINQQMIKGSSDFVEDAHSIGGVIENCYFYFTEGVANNYYTGGIDIHKGTDWIIRNNTFRDIISPTSNLTEGAIHFWSESRNTIIENNIIYNCDRGIMLGFDSSNHYGGIIRNNFIQTIADTGIYLCNTQDVEVYNNTVYIESGYPNAIEYRFSNTEGLIIKNNLTNKSITSRNGATAVLGSNFTKALDSWFLNSSEGDLHLVVKDERVINQGEDISIVSEDIDGDIRTDGYDIGADEVN